MPGQTSPNVIRYPLYTETADPATNLFNAATDINNAYVTVQNSINAALTRKMALVSGPGPQVVVNNTNTNMIFTSEDIDNDNMANLGVNNTILTVVTAGLYMLSASCSWSANATGDRMMQFRSTTGPSAPGFIRTETAAAGTYLASMEMLLYATAGTQLSCQVFQNSGANLNLNAHAFSAVRLSG